MTTVISNNCLANNRDILSRIDLEPPRGPTAGPPLVKFLRETDLAMNIYEIVSGCEEELPNGKVRKLFASVTFQPKDEMWLLRELQGKPFSKPWRPLELRFDKPKLPHADFPEFDYPALVCNERAMAAVGDVLRETGELFPVKVRGDKGAYQLHNIPSMKAKLLDAKKTTWHMIAGRNACTCPHSSAIGSARNSSCSRFLRITDLESTALSAPANRTMGNLKPSSTSMA